MKAILGKFINTGQIREPQGILKPLLVIFILALTVFQVWAALFGSLSPYFHNSIFISFMLGITFIVFSAGSAKIRSNKIPIYDFFIAIFLFGIGIYMIINHNHFLTRWPQADPLSITEMIIGIALLVFVYEITRRTLGAGMLVVVSLLIGYAFLGHLIPGTFGHQEISLMTFVDEMAFTVNGVFGSIASVAATYVFFFVLFGNLFNASGGGDFFYAISKAFTGNVAGGPAKVAVISSGLYGSISGSPTADVVTTGSFTIPSMKKAGYSPTYAGAIEATAATGGSFLPPVMGSAAFLMVEVTGIPYLTIALGALIPGLLFYIGIFLQVHFQAKKIKMSGFGDEEEVLRVRDVLKNMGQFTIPILVLIWILVLGYTPTFAAIAASIATIIVSYFKKETRLTPKKLVNTLYVSVIRLSPLIAVCAAAGLVVGVIHTTGLAGKFSALINVVSGDNLLLTLLVTALVCIVFGMGMPTPAAYVLTAVLAGPAMVESGIPLLQAHMFIVFFSCLSAITPPVAVAAYAAAAIADANPIKIAALGVRLGIIGFVIPFMFVYEPSLLMVGSFGSIMLSVLTAIIGIVALSAGFEGWFGKEIVKVERMALVIGGLLLIAPGIITASIGLIVLLIVLGPKIPAFIQDYKCSKNKNKNKNKIGELKVVD